MDEKNPAVAYRDPLLNENRKIAGRAHAVGRSMSAVGRAFHGAIIRDRFTLANPGPTVERGNAPIVPATAYGRSLHDVKSLCCTPCDDCIKAVVAGAKDAFDVKDRFVEIEVGTRGTVRFDC